MSHPLNKDQLQAVTWFDSDLLVTAGAGTGKTSVLAGKFLRLLEDRRATVTEVVAITFTKKAAAEMRTRIRLGILEHLTTAISGEETEFWKSQLYNLERARISTFHSLCLGLIREHPLEAGVPPVTEILGEGEETIYLNQAIETALTETFAVPDSKNRILTRFLMEMGWDSFLKNLGRVYQMIRESGTSSEAVIRLSMESLAAGGATASVGPQSLIELIEDLLSYSRTIELTEHAGEVIETLRENWPVYRKSLDSSAETGILNTLQQLKKALPKNVPNLIKNRVGEIRDLIDNFTLQLLDREFFERLPAISDLLKKVEQCYAELKRGLGLLDFTDQQLLARDLLLRYSELATQVRRGIHYILVDEFQDTNSLQLELINLLVGDHYQKGRLMAVGDVKQSIYRFRGAEAGLVQTLAGRLREKHGRLLSLTQNYRSNHTLIEFVNRIAGRLFEGESFSYEPLEAVEPDRGANIEFILTGSFDRQQEARLIAGRISQMARETLHSETPVRFGDIVLLFRAGTDLFIYQKALQEAGIPVFTASGRGFYRCQEVVDQLNLLKVVEQRFDGIALLGVLTSPYVGLTDESLFWLGVEKNLAVGFYQNETFPETIPSGERERLERFRETLNYLQQNREYLQIPGILRYALERLYYQEILRTFPNAGQRIANLEKLLAKADEFVARGFNDLYRFLDYIEKLEEVEVLEGEAQTQAEAGDAVRLMTIHRAKGLEFPIVFLPDLDRKFARSTQDKLIYHKEIGLGFSFPLDEGETGYPSLWEKIKNQTRREEHSELKRVFYVALTRAKQQLILVGSGRNRSKGDSIENADNWMKWLELLIPLERAEMTLEYRGISIRITRTVPEGAGPAPVPKLIDEYVPHLPGYVMVPSGPLVEREVAATSLIAQKDRKYRVTELLAYQDCPRRYFWHYVQRLAGTFTGAEADLSTNFEDDRDHLGSRIGLFIHQVFRLPNADWPQVLWEKTFADLNPSANHHLRTELELVWRNFRNSRFTEENGRCWDEIPFILKLEPGLRIEGRFDRLLQNQLGNLILVDYKTHRVTAAEAELLAPSYFPQLQLYAMAVEAFWGRIPDHAILYFPYSNHSVDVPLDPAGLARTKLEITKAVEFINNHHQFDDYPPGVGCEYCGYSLFCQKSGVSGSS